MVVRCFVCVLFGGMTKHGRTSLEHVLFLLKAMALGWEK